MQTVCMENPLAGKPKLIPRYRAPNQRTDERYLCMPFEPEKGSYLSLLSHELYLKIFWKACPGEHYDCMSYVCRQLRQLLLCPLTEWIREMEGAVHPVLKARSVYPPQWTPFKKREFNQVYTMSRAISHSSSSSHCHRIMDHHLLVGLSSAVYRLLHPRIDDESTPEIRQAQMKIVMDEGIICICRYIVLRNCIPVGRGSIHRVGFVNRCL